MNPGCRLLKVLPATLRGYGLALGSKRLEHFGVQSQLQLPCRSLLWGDGSGSDAAITAARLIGRLWVTYGGDDRVRRENFNALVKDVVGVTEPRPTAEEQGLKPEFAPLQRLATHQQSRVPGWKGHSLKRILSGCRQLRGTDEYQCEH